MKNILSLQSLARFCMVIFLMLLLSLFEERFFANAQITQLQLLYSDYQGSSYIFNADGSNKRKIAEGIFPQWSPDGSNLTYQQDNSLYISKPDGLNPQKIADKVNFDWKWSSDANNLAYTQPTSQSSRSSSLFIFNLNTNSSKKIADNVYNWFWSYDGRKIVFSEATNATSVYFSTNIFTVNLDGTALTRAFPINNGYLYGFWPDDQKIIYAEIPAGANLSSTTGILRLANLNGSNRQVLFDGGEATPQFQLIYLAVSPDKSKVLIKSFNGNYLVDVNDPVSSVKIFPGNFFGCSASEWSFEANKYLYLTFDYNTATANLEEIDVISNNTRVITRIPNVGDIGQCPLVNLTVEANGLVAFMGLDGDKRVSFDYKPVIFVVNTKNGQTNKIEVQNVGSLAWKPASRSYSNILPDFYQVWAKSDLAIATGQSSRSWLWGPAAFDTKTEDYKEAKDGKRQVQYFDKARMELNNPDGDRSNPFFVTNGLLPKELIGGFIQTGDNQSQPKPPAEINVAGDPNGSITYAKLAGVVTLDPGKNTVPNRVGQAVNATIDRNGSVTEGQALTGVNLTQYIQETGHNIPNVFVDYFKTLPQDWVFVMGFPISEPYITEISLAGKPTTALVQVFERRVLTYTPSNADPFKVEQGNVGRHYFQWRYGN
jgi:hypothetical protein